MASTPYVPQAGGGYVLTPPARSSSRRRQGQGRARGSSSTSRRRPGAAAIRATRNAGRSNGQAVSIRSLNPEITREQLVAQGRNIRIARLRMGLNPNNGLPIVARDLHLGLRDLTQDQRQALILDAAQRGRVRGFRALRNVVAREATTMRELSATTTPKPKPKPKATTTKPKPKPKPRRGRRRGGPGSATWGTHPGDPGNIDTAAERRQLARAQAALLARAGSAEAEAARKRYTEQVAAQERRRRKRGAGRASR